MHAALEVTASICYLPAQPRCCFFHATPTCTERHLPCASVAHLISWHRRMRARSSSFHLCSCRDIVNEAIWITSACKL